MKTLNIHFTDEEYKRLKKAKGTLSWHDLIIKLGRGISFKKKMGLKRGCRLR